MAFFSWTKALGSILAQDNLVFVGHGYGNGVGGTKTCGGVFEGFCGCDSGEELKEVAGFWFQSLLNFTVGKNQPVLWSKWVISWVDPVSFCWVPLPFPPPFWLHEVFPEAIIHFYLFFEGVSVGSLDVDPFVALESRRRPRPFGCILCSLCLLYTLPVYMGTASFFIYKCLSLAKNFPFSYLYLFGCSCFFDEIDHIC